jgi:hypothetical protein
VAHLGGVRGRWEVVVGGPAVVQVCATEQLAGPGDVMLSRAALDLLGDLATGGQVRLGASGPSALRLAGIRPPSTAARRLVALAQPGRPGRHWRAMCPRR